MRVIPCNPHPTSNDYLTVFNELYEAASLIQSQLHGHCCSIMRQEPAFGADTEEGYKKALAALISNGELALDWACAMSNNYVWYLATRHAEGNFIIRTEDLERGFKMAQLQDQLAHEVVWLRHTPGFHPKGKAVIV